MKKTKAMLALTLCMIMMMTAFAGCAGGGGGKTTEAPVGTTAPQSTAPVSTATEKVWREALPVDAQTANVHALGLNYDGIVADYCIGLLYREGPSLDGTTGEFIPELAAEAPVKMDSEGKVWQIKINPKAKWQNGDPINADTFMYSYKMCLDPDMLNSNGSRLANWNVEFVNATNYLLSKTPDAKAPDTKWEDVGIKKVDDMTIELTLVAPALATDLMRHLSLRQAMPVYEPYYEAGMNASRTTTTYATELDNFMACGPFLFTEWVKGAQRVYVKNPDSPIADRIKLDKVIYRIVPDANTRLQMFENGEIDYIELGSDSVPQYEEDPRLKISPSTLIFHFEINRTNPDKPIFQDVRFRRALYYSMDRNVFAKLTSMRAAPYYVSTFAYFDMDNGVMYRDLPEAKAVVPENGGYDPELAKKYFDEVMADFGLENITVKVLYEDTGDVLRIMAEYWQQDCEKIFDGKLKMEMVTMPDQQKTETMRDWKGNPTGYEIGGHAFSNAQGAFYPWMCFMNYTSNFQRYTNYGNTKMDEMYLKAISPEYRFDKAKLLPLLTEMEKEFIDDVLNLPTVEFVGYELFSEQTILPVDTCKPGIYWATMFADIDLSKVK